MTIGAALLLIAAGAILRFAINTVSTHGINVHTIGDILMIVGILGLILWMFVWAPWARNRRARTTEDRPYTPPRQAADPYRDRPVQGDPYGPNDRTYQDPYPPR
jgi:hypothetical protein